MPWLTRAVGYAALLIALSSAASVHSIVAVAWAVGVAMVCNWITTMLLAVKIAELSIKQLLSCLVAPLKVGAVLFACIVVAQKALASQGHDSALMLFVADLTVFGAASLAIFAFAPRSFIGMEGSWLRDSCIELVSAKFAKHAARQ